MDGKWVGDSDVMNSWNEQVPVNVLQSVRSAIILHQYAPDDLGSDINKWLSATGVTAVFQLVESIFGGGKGGGKGSGAGT